MTAPEYQALFNGGREAGGDSAIPTALYILFLGCLAGILAMRQRTQQ